MPNADKEREAKIFGISFKSGPRGRAIICLAWAGLGAWCKAKAKAMFDLWPSNIHGSLLACEMKTILGPVP